MGMTSARSISARQIGHASGWLMATCDPRRAASRGEPMSNPSGTSHSSWSAMISSVCATDFARNASIPASAVIRTASSIAASTRIDGVPAMNRVDAGRRRIGPLHRELAVLPNQPWIGDPNRSASATCR